VRFKNSDRIPFFQFIAKNVGIRRARGEFVLATNIDILFSDQLMARLARRDLNADSYYRIDRYDVPSHIPENASLDEQLNYCQNHVLRVFRRDGTYSHVTRAFYRIYPRSSGMFGKSLLLAERILTEMKIVASLFITNKTFRRNLLRYEHLRSNVQSGVYSDRLHRIFEFLETPQRSRLHTNASGDFTLMGKDRWSGLRGYPELTLHGMHIDSILCYMAHYLPLREMIFRDPMRIYHIDHLHSWTPEAGRTEAFYRRLRQRGIPWMSHEELNEFAISLMEGRRPIVFNDENWGLSGENLRETVFGPSQ
jgi:hypothetical protein